ncbi:hypothetical protein TNCV_2467831 [Trichonephila clavipes]|nr:hypothetical protein TNCV_2467831 [Trichonephila clavipes]
MATHILSRQGQSQTKAVKAKQKLSKRKIIATAFWDKRNVLLADFMPQGTTINSGAYCATLRKPEEHCKTNGSACCQKVSCSPMIKQGLE